jgi:hypothetical protein
MNPLQRERWVSEVLREVMTALMHDESLRQALVFKGAWILNLHLGESRHSMDIDASAEPGWVKEMGSMKNQEAFLREHLPSAVRRHFEPEFRSSRGRRRCHAWLRKTLGIAAAVSNGYCPRSPGGLCCQ